MTELKNIYVDSAGLLALIKGDRRNEYPLRWGRGGESDENPLPMLNYNWAGKYFLKIDDDGLIVAAATMYPYAKGVDDRYLDADSIYLSQVGVHKDHRHRGYAKNLLNSVFSLAAKTDSVLRISGFMPDGRKYLAPLLPVMHTKYPQAKVLYDGETVPVTGEMKYKLQLEWGEPQILPL